LSVTVVSYISSGALSWHYRTPHSHRKDVSTSEKIEESILLLNNCEACVIEIPGSAVGMYSEDLNKGGINWLPI